MPNNIMNILILKGSEEENQKIFQTILNDDKFDFNTLTSMPEQLKLKKDNLHEEAFFYYLSDKGRLTWKDVQAKYPEICNEICAKSYYQRACLYTNKQLKHHDEEMSKRTKRSCSTFYDYGKMLHQIYQEYGAIDWYDWACKYWGTKWNAYEQQKISENCISFYTAWSAPFPIYTQLASKFPSMHALVFYADEDMGNNCGILELDEGELWETANANNLIDSEEFAELTWITDISSLENLYQTITKGEN